MLNHSVLERDDQLIIYDPGLIESPDAATFEAPAQGSGGAIAKTAGRRAVYFLRLGGCEYVLRHYWRGGQAARLSEDAYLWLGAERSRPFREWRLLDALYRRGLPVPRPAAARVVRQGLIYRGDILTERLPETRTLAELAAAQPLDQALWAQVGAVIRRFHEAGAYHADLNASNILLEPGGGVFLIDWDRGRFRRADGRWRQANLVRLARSLQKFERKERRFHYSASDWQVLVRGYEGSG